MFSSVKYGPWYPGNAVLGCAPPKVELVARIMRARSMTESSLLKPDRTSLFRDTLSEELGLAVTSLSDSGFTSLMTYDEFRRYYWGQECFRKLSIEDPATVRVLEVEAVEKLLLKECLTAELDDRLRTFRLCGKGLTPSTADAIRKARKIVARLLGKFSWDRVVEHVRWGPGASTEFSRKASSHQNKWACVTHATADVLPLVESFSYWSKFNFGDVVEVGGNRITTVPKDAQKRRTIAIEPTWNMFFQLGIEGVIRRCLNRAGLLCESATENAQKRHQELARVGSTCPGLFPTLDFRDASNSISRGLCGLLLPSDWLDAMYRVRSHVAELPDGTHVPLAMFSTMGNGYTFALMTLLIYSLSSAVVGGPTSVFGDDLILPDAQQVDTVCGVFEELGFSLNIGKSFWKGHFRESCGGHFYRGRDVTPPYFKRELKHLQSYISYGNALTRRYRRCEAWRLLLDCVPRGFRGPEGFGDSVLVTEWDMATPRWSQDYQCWYGQSLVGYHPMRDAPEIGALRHALYGAREAGLEVYRGNSDLAYRTGVWLSPRW